MYLSSQHDIERTMLPRPHSSVSIRSRKGLPTSPLQLHSDHPGSSFRHTGSTDCVSLALRQWRRAHAPSRSPYASLSSLADAASTGPRAALQLAATLEMLLVRRRLCWSLGHDTTFLQPDAEWTIDCWWLLHQATCRKENVASTTEDLSLALDDAGLDLGAFVKGVQEAGLLQKSDECTNVHLSSQCSPSDWPRAAAWLAASATNRSFGPIFTNAQGSRSQTAGSRHQETLTVPSPEAPFPLILDLCRVKAAFDDATSIAAFLCRILDSNVHLLWIFLPGDEVKYEAVPSAVAAVVPRGEDVDMFAWASHREMLKVKERRARNLLSSSGRLRRYKAKCQRKYTSVTRKAFDAWRTTLSNVESLRRTDLNDEESLARRSMHRQLLRC